MRQIEEANKFELVLSIKALVARALANELIEGGDVRYWPKADIGALSTFFNSEAVNLFRHHLIRRGATVMFSLRVAGIASAMAVIAFTSVTAQTTGTIPPQAPPSQPLLPPTANQYSSNEIIDAGHHFFGSVSHGLAMTIEKAVTKWGLPNGYILGEEAGGAFIAGLRYGDGTLYTRNAGDVRVFWEGPSIGFDAGADGARTMMLVYSLPQTGAIFNRFGGINGSAYLVGGFGMTALTGNNMVVVPIRSGIGLRLGADIGWLKFTDSPTWNPF